MFWNTLVTSSSSIDLTLDSPNVTLTQVLDLEELLQECRVGHRKLLEFLQRSDNLSAMLDFIISEPLADLPVSVQFKYPNISCEVLTSDISFSEKLAAERSYLDKLFSFFRKDPNTPLNPLLASYVTRVLSEIIARKADQNWYSYKLNTIHLLGYLTETESDVLGLLLDQIGTSSVCDLLFKLVMNLEGEDVRETLLSWLNKNLFVSRLMKKMGDDDENVHEGVFRLVSELFEAFTLQDDMSSASKTQQNESPLVYAFKRPRTLIILLESFLTQKEIICESSIKYGLNLVVALMGIPKRPNRPMMQKSWVSLYEYFSDLNIEEEASIELIKQFPKLLNILSSHDAQTPPLTLTYGAVENRVGTMRLSIVNFFAHLASLRNPIFINEMVSSGVLKYIVDLFWKNAWNGFLHRDVEKILLNILLMTSQNTGFKYLLEDLEILIMMMKAFRNPETRKKTAYMGYIVRFASAYIEMPQADFKADIFEELSHSVKGNYLEEWDKFLKTELQEYLFTENVLLAGVMVPHSGAQLGSKSLSSDDQFSSDMNSWSNSDLKNVEINSEDFGVFTDIDSDAGRTFELFCALKENGLEAGDGSDILSQIPGSNPEPFDEEEWGGSEALLKELSGLST